MLRFVCLIACVCTVAQAGGVNSGVLRSNAHVGEVTRGGVVVDTWNVGPLTAGSGHGVNSGLYNGGLSNIALGNIGLGNVGLGHGGLSNVGLSNVGLSNIGLGNVGLGHGGLSNVGLSNVGLSNVGLGNVGLGHGGLSNVGLVNRGLGGRGLGGRGIGGRGLGGRVGNNVIVDAYDTSILGAGNIGLSSINTGYNTGYNTGINTVALAPVWGTNVGQIADSGCDQSGVVIGRNGGHGARGGISNLGLGRTGIIGGSIGAGVINGY